jgi:hypothetical protein
VRGTRELGKKFAVLGLVRVLCRVIIGVTKRPDPLRPPDRFFCSQFVSRSFCAGGGDIVPAIADDFTEPGDLARSPVLRKVGVLKP